MTKALYDAFQAADDAWGLELERRYRGDAGDARYDRTRNGHTEDPATSTLAKLLAIRVAAYDKWWSAKQAEGSKTWNRYSTVTKAKKPQDFDVSPLPLFGDSHKQAELF